MLSTDTVKKCSLAVMAVNNSSDNIEDATVKIKTSSGEI